METRAKLNAFFERVEQRKLAAGSKPPPQAQAQAQARQAATSGASSRAVQPALAPAPARGRRVASGRPQTGPSTARNGHGLSTPPRAAAATTSGGGGRRTVPPRADVLARGTSPRQEAMHELSASVAKAKLQAALRELALVKETNAQLTTKMMSTNANKSSLQRRVEELRGVVSVSQDMEQESAARIRELERALKEAESKINNSTRVHESQLWEETQRAKAAATAAAAAHSAQLEAERKRAEEMRDSIVRAGKAREAQLEAQAAEREEALKAQHRVDCAKFSQDLMQARASAREEEAKRQAVLLKEMSSRVEHLEGLLKQANDQMAAQRRDLEAEVTAERGKVQAVEHQLADVQRAREAERVEAAQQRVKDAASFQRTKAALTEGIEKEIAERQKMELRAQHAEQETEAVRVQVTSLNNIIEQMRASSHELQSKAEAVVSSAAAQSIEAAEEANKLRAELEQHRQSATALPALQKQLDVVNRQRQALLRKVEELEGKLGESLDENAAMATNMAAMRNHVTELSMQVVGGGHAGGAWEGGEQEGEGGAAAAVASAGAGVGAGAVVLGTASPRNRKRASKVLRSPAASPALLKAMASPALAAVLSRVDTQVDRLNAQPDGAVVQTAAGAALARVMLTCVCRYVRRTRLVGALARWRTAIRWEDVRAMMTEKFDTINQLQEELQEAEEQAETSNIGCNTDATGAIVMEATADHRMLEAMERVRSEEKARLESTMNSLTSQFELLIHNNQAKEEAFEKLVADQHEQLQRQQSRIEELEADTAATKVLQQRTAAAATAATVRAERLEALATHGVDSSGGGGGGGGGGFDGGADGLLGGEVEEDPSFAFASIGMAAPTSDAMAAPASPEEVKANADRGASVLAQLDAALAAYGLPQRTTAYTSGGGSGSSSMAASALASSAQPLDFLSPGPPQYAVASTPATVTATAVPPAYAAAAARARAAMSGGSASFDAPTATPTQGGTPSLARPRRAPPKPPSKGAS